MSEVDQRAFAELFEESRHDIYSRLRIAGASREDAEDALQTVTLRALRGGLDGEWMASDTQRLYKPTLKRFRDLQRSTPQRLRSTAADIDALPPMVDDRQLSPEDELEMEEERVILAEALEELERTHPHFYLPIKMHYFDGMEYTEVAATLDRPFHTIRGQRQRGLEILRDIVRRKIGEKESK
jgi:RNA polymerase sigma factor (sigma-70 family)